MALRIKSHWWNDESERSIPEIGSALAFIAWRIAVDKAITLHCERFVYRDDAATPGGGAGVLGLPDSDRRPAVPRHVR